MVVTEDESRLDITEALLHLNAHTKRLPHVTGVSSPSNWDVSHDRINALLDALDAASDARP